MTSWFAAKLVPSYLGSELDPYWSLPPERESLSERQKKQVDLSGQSVPKRKNKIVLFLVAVAGT